VELFTSEGCSSCPPADALLSRLEKVQPVPGVEVIALGEHVDYWNYIGWQDPFSSPAFSDRQREYARISKNGRIYTPQMVVDGQDVFVGSDASQALAAISRASRAPKANLEVVLAADEKARAALEVRVTGIPPASKGKELDVFAAITEGALESSVSRGENAGRKLLHDAVVRKLIVLSKVASGQAEPIIFRQSVALDDRWRRANLRIVVFLQERGSRRILGASAVPLTTSGAPTSERDADVSGVWDAEISGTQQSTGYPQKDEAILSLRQSGSNVSGTMAYAGVSGKAALTGTVSGSTFKFIAALDLGPKCRARFEVSAKVTSREAMKGSYSAKTCEDTVRGTITAGRRQGSATAHGATPRFSAAVRKYDDVCAERGGRGCAKRGRATKQTRARSGGG